jgi:hypothetical protein
MENKEDYEARMNEMGRILSAPQCANCQLVGDLFLPNVT